MSRPEQPGIFESILVESQASESASKVSVQLAVLRKIKNVMLTVILFFAVYNFSIEYYSVAVLEIVFVLLIFLIWPRVEDGRFLTAVFTDVTITFASILLSMLLLTGGIERVGYIWAASFPLVAVLLKGMRGMVWAIGFLAANVLMLVGMHVSKMPMPYTVPELLQAAFAYMFNTVLAYAFEAVRIRQQVSRTFGLDRFRALIENSSDSIAIIDSMTNLLYVSPAYTRIYGYNYEEAIGQRGILMVHPDDRLRVMKVVAHALTCTEESTYTVRYRHKKKEGGWVFVETAGRFYTGENGERYAILSTRDISEQVNLELQLQQSQKLEAIGTLVGGIAHNINNVLAAIVGNVFLARGSVDESSAARVKLNKIDALSMKAKGMISQLLAFARKGPVKKRNIQLQDICHEVCSLVGNVIPASVTLHCDLAEEPLVIYGDATQLEQGMVNLLTNAKDALKDAEHPEIRFELEACQPDARFYTQHALDETKQLARIRVSDNGCGIDLNYIDRIFDPFFTTKEVGEGTGLGLSMLHGVVTMHHGAITVSSEPGKGTCFELYLPLCDEDADNVGADEGEGQKGPVRSHQDEMLLIVDDSEELLEVLGLTLQALGYRVLYAESGEQALEVFNQYADQIRLVLMDVVMPGMGGGEAVQQMRKMRPQLQVIFMTGYDEGEIKNDKLPSGCTVLRKPVEVETLSREISACLTAGEAAHE